MITIILKLILEFVADPCYDYKNQNDNKRNTTDDTPLNGSVFWDSMCHPLINMTRDNLLGTRIFFESWIFFRVKLAVRAHEASWTWRVA